MKKVELKNLNISINLESFKDEYKEKNFAFFTLLDKAVINNNIKVYRATEEENDYYNLIVIECNNIYNAFPEPMLMNYISIEEVEKKIKILETEREEMNNIMKSQRETSYMYLKTKEDRAKLILKLIKLTNGKLTKEEMEEIVNNIDISLMFDIRVITDAKEFANEVTLKNSSNEWDYEYINWHSVFLMNVERYETKYEDKYVLDDGNFNFGYYDEDYEDNNITPNFNINKKYGIMLKKDCGSNCNDYNDETKYELIIYLPSSEPYKIDKEIQYVLDNFNIN